MTPSYLNSSTSLFSSTLSTEDDQHLHFYTANLQASSCSSISNHLFTYSVQDQEGPHHRGPHHSLYQQDANNDFASYGGSHSLAAESEFDRELKLSLWKKENQDDQKDEIHDQNSSANMWMPLKIRLTRKMMVKSGEMGDSEAPTNTQLKFEDPIQPSSPLEADHNSSNNSSNPIRVCSDCNTTKTPLWRSGPRGPKSLCNACGIRQRKARRAMAAAAANGMTVAAETSSVKKNRVQKQKEHKKSSKGHNNIAQYKKRSKLATPSQGRKKLCFEDFFISLSKNLAFHQVFPQDEKEAAILLMALSSGLVHG